MHSIIAWAGILASLSLGTVWLRWAQKHWAAFSHLIEAACGEVDAASEPSASRGDALVWWLIGALFMTAAFAFLEIRQPYYFAQDDALVAEMPGMLAGCRSVWTGVWPDYDPCRLMGGPLASAGAYSLTYPPTYLSYSIARYLLRNEYALLDVFAALHLAVGYIATTWLCRRLGMRPMIACCATLSFLLSGSILIMGRSWHAFLPIVLWLPLLMIAVQRLAERPVGWKWALATGGAAGILFHVGFPQVWVYSLLLISCSLLLLLITGAISLKRLLSAWPAAVIALGVAAPLLLPQVIAARGVVRPPLNTTGITSEWIAAILPYPLVTVAHPMGWGSIDSQYMGHFIYFGTAFAVLFIASALAVTSRLSLRAWSKNIWLGCAIIALLLTAGDRGLVFWVLSKLPLLSLVNNDPFRALPFFVLFAVAGSGVFVERALQAGLDRRYGWSKSFAFLTLLLLAYHVAMARPSFYTYGFRPYPPLASSFAQHIGGGDWARVNSWTTKRSISPKFADALPLDLPMLYGIPALSGYDPLLEWGESFRVADKLLEDQPLESLRAYGVRWHLVSALARKPILSRNPGAYAEERSVKYKNALKSVEPLLQFVAHTDTVRLEALSDVAPMAFAAARPAVPMPLTAAGDGITVALQQYPAGGKTIVNFLWYPQMQAQVDGKPCAISHDEWRRIVVDVPAGAALLRIRYVAGWPIGMLVGVLLVATGLLGAWIGGRWSSQISTVST